MKVGEVIGGRFELERLAGSGGMGAVFRALDRVTSGSAAVKALWSHCLERPEHAERFAREARVLQSLAHPGIVRYLTHGVTGEDEPWLALEWLEGETLSQRLRRQSLAVVESLELGRRLAEALVHAHQRGVIHRDLKPSNVYLVGGSVTLPKLIDFGIAKVNDGAALTLTGVVMGTPLYMAPEQARGSRAVDARTDLFALGCLLFHCLAGRPPFAAEEANAALLKVALDDAPRLREVWPEAPLALDGLLARMLSRDPMGRPSDAAEVAAELDRLLTAELGEPTPLSPRAAALTGRERRVVSAVLVRLPISRPVAQGVTPTLPSGTPAPAHASLGEIVERFHGKSEIVAEGIVLVTLPSSRAATDQAGQAARCAIAIQAELSHAGIAVTCGRGGERERRGCEEGNMVSRGLALLERRADPGGIRIDDLTAGLVGARFLIGGDAAGLVLLSERGSGPRVRTVLGHVTPCVGREHELAMLAALYAECSTEPCARAILITGDAGIGKSRLCHEFQQYVTAPGAQVWTAEGDPMSEGSPFGMLGQMLRREAGLSEGDPIQVRYHKLRARVGRHALARDATRIAQFLGRMAGTPSPGEESVELSAARADAVLMGDQMRRAWEDLLLAETAHGPLVLVLEDLHWGDVPTIKFVDAALRNLREAPLLVVALARPVVRDLFPKLWADRALAEIHLRELGRRGSEKLVRAVLGDAAGSSVVSQIVERALGNPFYLEEMLRVSAEGGSAELPEAVLAMAEARLETLDSESRRVLRAASIFGQVFYRGGIASLLGDDGALSLDHRLGELVEREIIAYRDESRFPGEAEYIFRHGLLREAAYAMLPIPDRTAGHLLAAKWLERVGEREALVLAEHFERGGAHDRAAPWFKRAAEQALEGDDFASAISRAERGAAHAPGELLGVLRLIQAEAHKWMGSASDAERCASEAMTLFSKGSPPWHLAASEVGSMRLRLGRHEELAALAADVKRAGFPAVRPEAEHARGLGEAVSAMARLSGSLLHDGQHQLAEELIIDIDRASPSLREKDYRVAARIWALHASRALCYGDPAGSLGFTELAIPSFDYTGDRRNACLGRVNAAAAIVQLGDPGRAERILLGTAADADRMGLLNVAALARQNLAVALLRQDRLDEARAVASVAIGAFVAQSNKRQEGRSRAYLAEILAARGDLEGAEREARSAAECLSPIPPLAAFSMGILAMVLLLRERARAALEVARDGARIREGLAGIEEGEARLLLVHTECLDALHERESADEALRFARDRLLARAARIRDTGLRASFLRRVPEHARTLQLANRLS